MRHGLINSTTLLLFILFSAASMAKPSDSPLRVAFMPDIHFHDVYADLSADGFTGIPTGSHGKKATIRTMAAQLHSTRLFNENYFALLAALDDAVKNGIRYIALPGDFSDDGQPIHLNALAKILDRYSREYGVQFFATPGNHDPVRPFDTPGGKSDFLQADGREISIQSPGTDACQNKTGRQSDTLICTPGIRHLGYHGVAQAMKNTGLFPQSHYLYWETPFSDYTPDNYDYSKAHSASALTGRHYNVCDKNTAGQQGPCVTLPDTSYLVEPVAGLWLLAIDANVYQPDFNKGHGPIAFSGSGNAGYNAVSHDKKYLLDWIAKVVQQANLRGKKLVSFSHFPMVDFYDQQAPKLAALFGKKAFQAQRLPRLTTSDRLAQTGLMLHVSGHMHMNDTGIYRSATGQTLFNIQAPSLAAYPPAYKVLTLLADNKVEVSTVRIDHVPRFNELFPHYQREYDHLRQHHPDKIWNHDILEANNYNDYTQRHLRELVRLRFLPQEWPVDIRRTFNHNSLRDLATLATLPAAAPLPPNITTLAELKNTTLWHLAEKKLKPEEFAELSGFDLLVDFYKLRNGGYLARQDINAKRLTEYRTLASMYQQTVSQAQKTADAPTLIARHQQLVAGVLDILMGFLDSEPDNHFMIDLNKGQLTRVTPAKPAP